MSDLITILSVLLFVGPIFLGIGAFAAEWLKDEFYKFPFYEDYDQ